MGNLVTSTQVKTIVTPVNAFDPSFFDTSIQYIEDSLISCILTKGLYDALVIAVAAPPLTPAYQALYDVLLPAEAYAIAFESYQKDLERKSNNQGLMENSTQYSKSAQAMSANRILKTLKDREFFYCKALGDFLIDNEIDYPLFVANDIYYSPNFRRFFPI